MQSLSGLSVVFGVDRSVIGKHIRNVYKTGELDREATWAKIAQVQIEGGRHVKRTLEYLQGLSPQGLTPWSELG